jgi:hypothetical protein
MLVLLVWGCIIVRVRVYVHIDALGKREDAAAWLAELARLVDVAVLASPLGAGVAWLEQHGVDGVAVVDEVGPGVLLDETPLPPALLVAGAIDLLRGQSGETIGIGVVGVSRGALLLLSRPSGMVAMSDAAALDLSARLRAAVLKNPGAS